MGTEPKCCSGGIRSLAKLYDSIPDYRDLNHLSGEEFHSTLNTLRSTCQKLKLKTYSYSSEDLCSTTTISSSALTSNCQLGGSCSKKSKKSKKKQKSTKNENYKKCYGSQETKLAPEFDNKEKNDNSNESTGTKGYSSLSKEFCIKDNFKSKKNLGEEVKKFLQDLEGELKNPLTSLKRNGSRSFTCCSSKEYATKIQDENKKPSKKVPVPFKSTLRDHLRKSFSYNDLCSITEPSELVGLKKKNTTLELLSSKGESKPLKEPTKLSNYFSENLNSEAEGIPNIIVDLPSTEHSADNHLQGNTKSKQKQNKTMEYKVPFKLFDLDTSKKEKAVKHSTPSPIHPVARPNLAATLRAESSKKKVNELKNNCTFIDTISHFDWEVRKTPAWKTLSLNETHKQILQLRLATRKAEQALQQREYELNMELMRQRVKSAPLLLEGPTYCGPYVGKLSHACQKEGRRYMCQSNQQRTRRRKNPSRSHCCRRRKLLNISSALDDNLDSTSNTFRVQPDSSAGISEKVKTLRKIYGSDRNGAKTQSRNSNHSTKTQQSTKYRRKQNSNCELKKKPCEMPDESNFSGFEIDSGDDLSSLDRAFL